MPLEGSASGRPAREGAYGEPVTGGGVICRLCPAQCTIPAGGWGGCGVRGNVAGVLVPRNYGRIAATAVEPVEKKPLYHFHPGARLLSLGAFGCNLHCAFCQNWYLSQREPGGGEELAPEAAVERALTAGVFGIAFTFTEPIVWFEYVRDTARLAQSAGLKVVLKAAGFINREPLEELLTWVDALNVDVKAFREDFYRQVCGGSLAPVLHTVEAAVQAGRHVEVTTLLVPGLNDDPGELEELAAWLAGLDRNAPLHLPRFYPNWRLGGAPAGDDQLEAARRLAQRHLSYVYVGGTWSPEHTTTRCPRCQAALIRRNGFAVQNVGLVGGVCAVCGRPADVVGSVPASLGGDRRVGGGGKLGD